MAGKKTGKRLLTWVLVLVMALSLLPLNVLAANSGSGMNFDKQLADDKPDGDGNYTIQITAQATGKKVETTGVEPMDIVLVLDQSGSMADDFNGNSTNNNEARRQYAMKAAVNSFISEVAAKNADHRMAIVTFSDDAETLAGWTPVDKDGKATLISKISGLTDTPSGATNVGAGMQKAQALMNSSEAGTDRLKTVIVFTDGVPTTKQEFNTTVANNAISAAKDMKDNGVTIYTVGIFNGAKPTELYGKKKVGFLGFDEGECSGKKGDYWQYREGFFSGGDIQKADIAAGNRFLNYLSSNYDASEIGITSGGYDGLFVEYRKFTITNDTATGSDQGYYKTAVDASSLKNIFKVISDIVPEPDNADLNKDTVITDTLSDYFTFALTEDGKVDVKVYAEKGNEKTDITDKVTVNPNPQTKTVTVTNYDFSKYHTESDDPEELVIEIKVKPSGEGCREEEIPTNADTAENHAAKVEVKSEDGTKTTPVTSHETAKVTGHKVIYDLDGGTGDMTGDDLYYPQDAAVPVTNSVPTLEGYEFTGWTSDIEGDNNVYTSNGTNSITMPAANVTLTAQWRASKYTVTYEYTGTIPADAPAVPAETQHDYNENVTIANVPTLTGYTFHGWTLPEGLTANDGKFNMPAKNVTITGSWTKNEYNVTYEYTGTAPADAPDVPAAAQHEYGAEVTIENVPTLTGYTFHGWTLPEGLTANDGKFNMPAENVTITGYWTKNTIPTYTFDLSDLGTIKVNKNFVSKYGRSATRSFTATATIEKQGDLIVDMGPNTPHPNVPNNRSAVTVEPTYTKVGEATGTVTLKTDTIKAFDFGKDSKFQLVPGDYRITVEETNCNDRYVNYDTNDTNDTKPHTRYFNVSENGDISPIDSITITNEYTKRHSAATPSKPTLNTGDHYAYVMGYPDGTVRPNGSITRAEVSAILFRLLSDKTRDEYFTTESSFTDVKAGAWYNNSIVTLEKAGVIVDTAKGGAFRPNEAITRAELAAMLAQFSDAKPVKGVKFSDVSAEHWAYEAIAIAAKMGWIEGYPDGTFRPDATITRAEMMTLVNRALERVPSDEDHLLSKRVMLTFPDCKSGDWFYIAVQEATNSHTYERAATEKNGDEQWTALRANRDWTQLEK